MSLEFVTHRVKQSFLICLGFPPPNSPAPTPVLEFSEYTSQYMHAIQGLKDINDVFSVFTFPGRSLLMIFCFFEWRHIQ